MKLTKSITALVLSIPLYLNSYSQQVDNNFSVSIKSDPDSAEVYVNNIPRGKTPVQIEFEHNTLFVCELRKTGFLPKIDSLRLESDTIITVQLLRLSKLKIVSHPEHAAIYINDNETGFTPMEMFLPPLDTLRIRLYRNDCENWSVDIPPLNGDSTEMIANLTPKFSSINFYSEHNNTFLFVDDTLISNCSVYNLKLKSGIHKISVKNDSLKRSAVSFIRLNAGNNYSFREKLKKFSSEKSFFSFLVPGSAQLADGAWLKGAVIMGSSIMLALNTIKSNSEYNDQLNEYNISWQNYLLAKTETEGLLRHKNVEAVKTDLDRHYARRTLYFSLFAIVYVYSIFDAFLNHVFSDEIELISPMDISTNHNFDKEDLNLSARIKIKF